MWKTPQKQIDVIKREEEYERSIKRVTSTESGLKKQLVTEEKDRLNLIRKAQDERIKLMTDLAEKEKIQTQNNYNRQIEDLKTQLETDENLTVASKNAINSQIVSLQKQLNIALIDVDNKFAAERLEISRTMEDYQLAAMTDGIEKERLILNTGHKRQIEDLKIRLETERTLTEEQRLAINQNIVNLETAQKNEDRKSVV